MNNEMNSSVGRELTDQELLMIQGGGLFSALGSAVSFLSGGLLGGSGKTGVLPVLGSYVDRGFSIVGLGIRTLWRSWKP